MQANMLFMKTRVTRIGWIYASSVLTITSIRPRANREQTGQGRMPGPGGQSSSVENTDWHEQEEKRFIGALATQMDGWATAEPARRFVLVADPRSMGTLRQKLNEHTLSRIEQSVTGDHAHRPVADIEALINKV
jgi:protein required for attachment to host cells